MSTIFHLDASHKKVVVFSDTHLSHRFNRAQFNFLRQVIESADQVIINGDFWDKYETTFELFINSKWQQLFVLLKKKKAVYIYGNHDHQEFADERVGLFSVKQVDECLVTTGKHWLRVNHGHQTMPSWDVRYPLLFKNKLMLMLGNKLQLLGVKLLSEKFLWLVFVHKNFLAKRRSYQLPENEILVYGHSHLAEFNLAKKYINTGVIRWGLGQYLWVDGWELKLVRERYS